jgi:hypothetical protein
VPHRRLPLSDLLIRRVPVRSSKEATPMSTQVDPRGPRFGAAVTTVVLTVTLATGWWALLAVQAVVFALGAAGRSPYAPVWKQLRRTPPTELEDARPPAFAQAVGLAFALVGLAGTGTVVFTLAVSLALAAALLNAAFGLCLGCEVYLRLVLTRSTIRRSTA